VTHELEITLWAPLVVILVLWWVIGGEDIPVRILFFSFLITTTLLAFCGAPRLGGKVAKLSELPWGVHYVVHSNFTIGGDVKITALREVEPGTSCEFTGEFRFVALSIPPPLGAVVRIAWKGHIFRSQFYLKEIGPRLVRY
jgi:hypothetical protein